MPSITQLVKEYVEQKPYLQEALRQEIINYAALAEKIKHHCDKKNKTDLKHISVIMALRRYQEKIKNTKSQKIHYGKEAEANLKTNIHMFTVERSKKISEKINEIVKEIETKKGSVLHFIQGNYQVGIITNTYNAELVKKKLKGETIIKEHKNLVSIALKYSDELVELPGNLFILTRALAWENITIVNLIEAMSESIFIVYEEDANKALEILTRVMRENE